MGFMVVKMGACALRAKLWTIVLGMAGLITLVGCGGGPPPGPAQLATVPAAGTVTMQGKPIANASVSFQHSDGTATANGTTDADGKFTLSTYGTNDGAPVGKYKVTVAVGGAQEIEPGVLAPEPEGGFKSSIPEKYADPAQSGLEAEIPAGGKQDLAIELQ